MGLSKRTTWRVVSPALFNRPIRQSQKLQLETVQYLGHPRFSATSGRG